MAQLQATHEGGLAWVVTRGSEGTENRCHITLVLRCTLHIFISEIVMRLGFGYVFSFLEAHQTTVHLITDGLSC